MKALEEYLETDPEFAQELIDSFCSNLNEFRESLIRAFDQHDHTIFLNAHHKMKPTLSYTQNARLQQQADLIKLAIQQHGIESVGVRMRNAFCRLCNNAIVELKKQLQEYLRIPL